MDICISIFSKLADYTVAPVWQELSALIHYKSNVTHLGGKVERLGDRRNGMQLDIDAAVRNLEIIAPDVERWLDDVEKTIQDYESHFGTEGIIPNPGCLSGWCPNLMSRLSLSKRALKMSMKVDNLLGGGNYQRVSYPAPPPEVGFSSQLHEAGTSSSGVSNIATSTETVDLTKDVEYKLPYTKEVLMALQDVKIKIVGISGTIRGEEAVTVEEFIRRVKQQDLFEEVIFIVVSSCSDLNKIQCEIANMIGLSFERESFLERSKKLQERMKMDSKRVLVIFADVWKKFDLEAIGIPHFGGNNDCKVILMSPHPNVFRGMTTQSNFRLVWASTSMGGTISFESRNLIIRDVMDALKDDKSNPIVICGLGGIGKTTVVNEVSTRVKEISLFDEVALADCGREPDLMRIQSEISEFLGLKLKQKSLSGRADRLHKRLSASKRVLVILENVWTGLKLQDIGIPLCNDNNSCKVLLSSQNQDLFNEIETKKNFIIGFLLQQEAWSLFKTMAGSSIESPELRPVAQQILSECAGLPIAITTVGRALHGKSKQIWNDALRQLRRASPKNISGVIQNVYRKIELSYESLGSEEVKSLFMLCCLYSECSNIVVEDLVRHGLGLGLFKGTESMVERRNSVETLVDILKSFFLLLDNNEDGCVKVHDVVRDVALSIASEGKASLFSELVSELSTWPKKGICGQVYYSSTIIMSKTQKDDAAIDAKKPELLLLSGTKNSKRPPNSIFKGMEGLKVLDVRSINLSSILPSLSLLEDLQTLCLEHCELGNVSVIMELQQLVILSLRGSSIEEFPVKFGTLPNLRLLDLTGCRSDKKISLDVILSLPQLEELYMRDVFVKTDMDVSKLLSSSQLTTLEAGLPPINAELLRNTVLFSKLESFKLSIGWVNDSQDVIPCGNQLRLNLDINCIIESGITAMLKGTETAELNVKNLYALNVLDTECFLNLKSLTLHSCHALEYLIDVTYSDLQCVFPMLRLLKIIGSSSLKEISNGQLPMGSFKELRNLIFVRLPALTHLWNTPTHHEFLVNLRRVEMSSCGALRSLFSLSIANHLRQLEELIITSCSELEEIVSLETCTHDEEASVIRFPNLICLRLVDLNRLIGVSKRGCKNIDLPQLISLNLESLPELVSLCPQNLAPESSYVSTIQHLFDSKVKSFHELRFMVVSNCVNLLSLFSSNSMLNLQNLEQLEVRNCCSLKRLFHFEGLDDKAEDTTVTLSCLEKIELIDLPKLAYFWEPSHKILAFQNLKSLQVVSCRRLKYVFPVSVAGALVKLESIYVRDCYMMEQIVTKDEGETNKIVFPQVKALHLDKLPYLESFYPAPWTLEWPSLRTLVLCCSTMKTFVPTNKSYNCAEFLFNEKVNFPSLETLEIRDMRNFKEIWSYQLLPSTFCELVELHVSNCNKVLLLLPLYMQSRLQKLERLTVQECYSLEEIFEFRGLNSNKEHAITIPHPREAPVTSQLDKMKTRDMKTEQTLSFQNLTSISVTSCRCLRYLLSPSTAVNLRNLKNLSISMCELIEEIVLKPAEGDKAEDYIMLPQLCCLELSFLPNLTSFSQGNYSLAWPSMEEVLFEDCPNMQTFCFGLLSTPKLKTVALNHSGHHAWKGDLNSTIEYLKGKQVN